LLARLDGADPALAAKAAENQQAAAAADFELAKADASRFEALRAQGFVSQAALDARLAARQAAENRLAAATAQADVASNQRGYAELVADAPGVVSAVLAEPGQVLAAGAPAIRLARQGGQDKDALISVAENQVALFRIGRDVRIRLWANGERLFHGRVREVAPQADPVTRTFAVRIGFVDADAEVRLGMTATVQLGMEAEGVIELPSPSIVQQDGKPAVWVIGDGGALSLRPVVVAAFREDGVIVSGGVKAGEKIVAAGGQKIMPGERVRVLEIR
jgi:RND family efflux transporter MFP subunit